MKSYKGIIHFYFFKIKGNMIHKYYKEDHNVPECILINNNAFYLEECVDCIDNSIEYILFTYECADYILSNLIDEIDINELFKCVLDLDFNKIYFNKWEGKCLFTPTLFLVKEIYRENMTYYGINLEGDIKISHFDLGD